MMRYPNESDAYRAARRELLQAEKDLRHQVERVAAMRRTLPPGGVVSKDYVFEGDVPVRLSELFSPGRNILVAYSFMYGPKMAKACPMCTSFLDSLDGAAPHLQQRVDLVVIARSPLARLRTHAASRGWRHLRLLSSTANAYNRDYHGETAEGSQLPMMNVFARVDGVVRHAYGTELLIEPHEPGQNARHLDLMWPLWNVLDLTPQGRGVDWYPKLAYDD